MTFAEKVIQVALSQVGVREHGRNAGPEVEKYLAAVHLGPGYSWCGAFVAWCVQEAGRQGGYDAPAGPPSFQSSAGALRTAILNPTLWQDKLHLTWPLIYVLDHGGGQGHVGFGLEPLPGGLFRDVSGNTNQDGSREGDSVWEHTNRRIADIHRALRIA